eukprot:7115506-Alexandrium_andersonii.AAC.1
MGDELRTARCFRSDRVARRVHLTVHMAPCACVHPFAQGLGHRVQCTACRAQPARAELSLQCTACHMQRSARSSQSEAHITRAART